MQYRDDSSIWSEKYRPRTVNDCILPQRIKDTVNQYIKTGHVPTLLLTGPAGTGKTTLARAIANEMGADIMFINASSDGNIDTIRTQVAQFASTVSFKDAKKITVLDEADFLTQNAQAALRGLCEEFSENHSIFFTCNFQNRIIDALKSRSIVLDFKTSKTEKMDMLSSFMKRMMNVLDSEGIEYDKRVLLELVNKRFPDFRNTITDLQRYSLGGKIDAGILQDNSQTDYESLFVALKNKKFKEMRAWVANHSDGDSTHVFRTFYDKGHEKITPKGLPALILLLGTYSYRAAFVVDQEINLAAFLTEVMLDPNIEWV